MPLSLLDSIFKFGSASILGKHWVNQITSYSYYFQPVNFIDVIEVSKEQNICM